MFIGKRKRNEENYIGYMVQAVNPLTEAKISLFMREEYLERQDAPKIEELLRQHVKMADKDINLYFCISETLL